MQRSDVKRESVSRAWTGDSKHYTTSYTHRGDERETVALGDLHGSVVAEIINQIHLPLVGHYVFAGRLDHRLRHCHNDHHHGHKTRPLGPGHRWPWPHGQPAAGLLTSGRRTARRNVEDERRRLSRVNRCYVKSLAYECRMAPRSGWLAEAATAGRCGAILGSKHPYCAWSKLMRCRLV